MYNKQICVQVSRTRVIENLFLDNGLECKLGGGTVKGEPNVLGRDSEFK
jgi:hypothetical protein